MIPDRIKYTKEFSYHGISEWLGVEGNLEPGETIMEGLTRARQKVIDTFNSYIKETELPVQMQQLPVIDHEFEKVKDHLATIEFREDAQAYLETTEYSYTIEAKKIVNAKPLKNK